jgi:hypothetical protein
MVNGIFRCSIEIKRFTKYYSAKIHQNYSQIITVSKIKCQFQNKVSTGQNHIESRNKINCRKRRFGSDLTITP